jgi:(1->4)-alpha-D-glucan 1-alpha-D-glucosylmutase
VNRRPGHLPRATYRLQLNREFTFADATRIVPYLARLGISHIYTSPILKARAGSMHGYDVIDHTLLNPELGSREDFDRLVQALHERQMGLVVDVVPNHLGVMGHDNEWWLDVLENGPAARYASHFDIDWRPNRASLRDRVLIPVLGDAYGVVLERGELQLEFSAHSGDFAVRYHEHRMPIDPREYPRIFTFPIADELLPADDAHRADFESLMGSFANLPSRSDTTPQSVAIRYRDKAAHKRRLLRLIERSPQVLQHIELSLHTINGRPGEPSSFDALDRLLDAQAWRLSYWRVAIDEINYRRFFDVNDLAALRMNEAEVFEATHRFTFELIEQGCIDGLRIDHSDGLYDPELYFERLQQRFAQTSRAGDGPLYVVTEKILATHERLPEHWCVHGTTGYDFAALSTAWLVRADEEARMTRRYRQFTENELSFDQIAHDSKRLVMRASLAAEIEVLATQLDRIAQLDRHTADYTRAAMREAISAVIACFPVYRTYISDRGSSEEDRRIVRWAVNVARRRSTGTELSVFDFLQGVLLSEADGRPAAHAMLEFAMKFQQVTAPVTAKGIEDTAFYRYNRLVCLNEVGNDPRRYNASNAALHQANLERARSWPHAMLATSTHDTKRSEDVRARIAVLSDVPELWKRHLARWSRLNRSRRRLLDTGPAPDREDEYLLYQTLLGIWVVGDDPSRLIARLHEYLVKAAREAKRATSWISPNLEYEQALRDFVTQLLEDPERSAFVRDFAPLAETVAWFGAINSLAQVTLKLTCPGMPDIYQGTELPALTLVDPDNRRPVDFDRASALLEQVADLERLSHDQLSAPDSAASKLFVTTKVLQLRQRDPDLFAMGVYQPLQIDGPHREHAFAFARTLGNRAALVVVPRWSASLMEAVSALPLGEPVWSDTRISVGALADASMMDVLSGRSVRAQRLGDEIVLRVADALAEFPVAVCYAAPS